MPFKASINEAGTVHDIIPPDPALFALTLLHGGDHFLKILAFHSQCICDTVDHVKWARVILGVQ